MSAVEGLKGSHTYFHYYPRISTVQCAMFHLYSVFVGSLISTTTGWGRDSFRLVVALITIMAMFTTSDSEAGMAVTDSNWDNVPIMWGTIIYIYFTLRYVPSLLTIN